MTTGGLNWTAIEAIGVWATALIALGGIFFVRRQLRQVERTIRGNTNERLTTESFEIIKFLASRPESYPYFYLGRELGEDDENRDFVLYAAEMITNYLEHVVAQKEDMSARDWKTWEHFVIEQLQMSPVIREHLRDNKDWYSPELMQLAVARL